MLRIKHGLFLVPLAALLWSGPVKAAPLPGAIFTTDSTCTGVDLNIYSSKDAVYIDGGPAHLGAAGLAPGDYYVQVTAPDGTLLGTSVGSGKAQPVHVLGPGDNVAPNLYGEFAACYQLSAILIKASDNTPGYDNTNNPGGEYKVWVSTDSTFINDSTKTDNFKVKESPTPPNLNTRILVNKFYDTNTNGIKDSNEPYLTGWKVEIQDGVDKIRDTPVNLVVDPDTYYVTEFAPNELNWIMTGQTLDGNSVAYPVTVQIALDESKVVEFGNVCLGGCGALTLGFWSNKNGQALFGADDLALMVSLNLRNANGTNFDPTSYTAFRTWLLNATATNMAYMLSAQLAAMELNVLNGKVVGNELIYAPGTNSANAAGFASVNNVMAEANIALGANGYTVASDATRSYQEALKNALDKANNNLTFVQPAPGCPFTFSF